MKEVEIAWVEGSMLRAGESRSREEIRKEGRRAAQRKTLLVMVCKPVSSEACMNAASGKVKSRRHKT